MMMAKMSCKFNFSAGPATIPKDVLAKAQSELLDWNGTGMSVMEMSHRGKEYAPIIKNAELNLKKLLGVPKNYKILFLQGGAVTQNFIVPMNLLGKRTASYVISGYWSKRTFIDAQPFTGINVSASSESNNYTKAPKFNSWEYKKDDAYIHFCLNETVNGVEYFDDPDIKSVPIVCDMSSTILSRPIDVSSYGVIYAGAQKNIGPAGLTILIVRDDLLGFSDKKIPSTLNWKIQSENNSMINTPPSYGIYIAGLVFDWLLKQGGLDFIEKVNLKKSNYLYDFIDSTDFYINNIDKTNRSRMNITFNIYNDELTSEFLVGAEKKGLFGLKGHRVVGGLRASIYNAMPFEGVVALVDYMKEFKNIH
jgi:phosphoserine aminotransferase